MKPPEVLLMERMRSAMKQCCMHPNQTHCRGQIKAAHALQNNKIISLLAGKERHVYMMNIKRKPLLITLKNGDVLPMVLLSLVSAKDATTETCFCDFHDSIAFSIIETGAPDFDEKREDMKFIYAYKAFIFEYYKQWVSMDIFRKNFKNNPAAFTSPAMVGMYRMLQMKTREFEPIKQHFDTQIIAGTCNGVVTCAVKIPIQIKFANYAYIAPDFDMNGRRIKHTKKTIMHRIAITVFPEETQSWFLLSCLEEEKDMYSDLFDQVKEASLEKLKFYINMMLPLYSENIVLSPALWDTWSNEVQMAYTYYANLNGPDAAKMGMAVGMGLSNLAKDKSGNDYSDQPKLNLFV